MNWITEFDIRPGVYKHYKGGIYVVTELITHMDGPDGAMAPIADPLVCYRDLEPIVKLVDGRRMAAHQVYARPLSEFNAEIHIGTKRFTHI